MQIYKASIKRKESKTVQTIYVQADDSNEAYDIAQEEAQYRFGNEWVVSNIDTSAQIFIHSNEQGSGFWFDFNTLIGLP